MADSEAIIGQGTFIRGNVHGDGDMNVAGRVEGNIELSGEVAFEDTAIIQSEVTANRILVRGAVAGDLHASDSIVLEAGCRVVGDLDAPRIRIDEGALFRGRIEMGDVERAPEPARKTAPRARAVPRSAPRTVAASRAKRTSSADAPTQQEPEADPSPPSPPAPPVPKPRKPKAKTQADESVADQPPPPVVPALKKKSKGAVRKRGAR